MQPELEEVKPEADAPKSKRIPFSASEEEEQDLIRRAGEMQVATAEKTTVQDYIRSQLWPNGSPS